MIAIVKRAFFTDYMDGTIGTVFCIIMGKVDMARDHPNITCRPQTPALIRSIRGFTRRSWWLPGGWERRAFGFAMGIALWFALSAAAQDLNSAPKRPTAGVEPDKTAAVDLDGRLVDPLQEITGKAVVLVFIGVECPISNRYAPEIKRLHARFKDKGIAFWLVHPDADYTSESIRKHAQEYGYKMGILRDPKHALVRRAQVRITPEAAVFVPPGQLVYHGRIDDRFVDLGLERPEPAHHDLEEILEAIVAGKVPPLTTKRAIGCTIPALP